MTIQSQGIAKVPDSRDVDFWRVLLKNLTPIQRCAYISLIGRHNITAEEEILLWQELAFELLPRS